MASFVLVHRESGALIQAVTDLFASWPTAADVSTRHGRAIRIRLEELFRPSGRFFPYDEAVCCFSCHRPELQACTIPSGLREEDVTVAQGHRLRQSEHLIVISAQQEDCFVVVPSDKRERGRSSR